MPPYWTSENYNGLATREEVAVAVCGLYEPLEMAATPKGLPDSFLDQADISTWARDSINTLSAEGILTGYPDHTFQPKGTVTQAEAVKILSAYRAAANAEWVTIGAGQDVDDGNGNVIYIRMCPGITATVKLNKENLIHAIHDVQRYMAANMSAQYLDRGMDTLLIITPNMIKVNCII